MSDLIDRQALLNEYDKAHVGPPGKARKLIEDASAASPWHRADEEPKESGKQYVVWASEGYAYCDKWLGDRWLISSVAPETVTHWMPIEPPQEDADGNT